MQLYPGLDLFPCSFESGRTINVCLFSGAQRLLVDAGVASTPAERIIPALRGLGLTPRDLDWLVCTHAHADHLGGIAALLAASDGRLRVLAHALDARGIADHRYLAVDINGMSDERGIAAYLARCGPDVPVHIALQGEEIIDLQGQRLQVLHAPGHTVGNLSLFEPTHGALVHGESVMNVPPRDGDGRRPTGHLGLDPLAYRGTLGRLQTLPFEYFIPSHEAPLDRRGGMERIAAGLAELDEFEGHVRAARSGGAATVGEVTAEVARAGQYQFGPTLERQIAALLRVF